MLLALPGVVGVEYLPFGHRVHTLAPGVEIFPTEHLSQPTLTLSLLKKPAGQFSHRVNKSVVLSSFAEKSPFGHASHAIAASDEKKPCGHTVQNVPVAPDGRYFPLSQFLHSIAPTSICQVPAPLPNETVGRGRVVSTWLFVLVLVEG